MRPSSLLGPRRTRSRVHRRLGRRERLVQLVRIGQDLALGHPRLDVTRFFGQDLVNQPHGGRRAAGLGRQSKARESDLRRRALLVVRVGRHRFQNVLCVARPLHPNVVVGERQLAGRVGRRLGDRFQIRLGFGRLPQVHVEVRHRVIGGEVFGRDRHRRPELGLGLGGPAGHPVEIPERQMRVDRLRGHRHRGLEGGLRLLAVAADHLQHAEPPVGAASARVALNRGANGGQRVVEAVQAGKRVGLQDDRIGRLRIDRLGLVGARFGILPPARPEQDRARL